MYRFFDENEFACSCCGENHIRPSFVSRLDRLREVCGFPFVITSGWRCRNHPSEAVKEKPGMHHDGCAADIQVADGTQRRKLVQEALRMGFDGVGVADGFVHVDDRKTTPVLWTY